MTKKEEIVDVEKLGEPKKKKGLLIVTSVLLGLVIVVTAFLVYISIPTIDLLYNQGNKDAGEALGLVFGLILLLPITIVGGLIDYVLSLTALGLSILDYIKNKSTYRLVKLIILSVIIAGLIVLTVLIFARPDTSSTTTELVHI